MRKKSQVEKEQAAQRLDCFMSVLYLFPGALNVQDMDMLVKREEELSKIYRYTGRTFFTLYLMGCGVHYFRRGSTPFFRDVMKHTVLLLSGTFITAMMAEKLASELHYNRLLIQMADKYNFSPEEVMDLQRNLNQYYIRKEREHEIHRDT